jgi:hypothetical protein
MAAKNPQINLLERSRWKDRDRFVTLTRDFEIQILSPELRQHLSRCLAGVNHSICAIPASPKAALARSIMWLSIIVAGIVTALTRTAAIGCIAGGAVEFLLMLRSKDKPLRDPFWILMLLVWPLFALIFYFVRGRV